MDIFYGNVPTAIPAGMGDPIRRREEPALLVSG
jgi:hypothetical protein